MALKRHKFVPRFIFFVEMTSQAFFFVFFDIKGTNLRWKRFFSFFSTSKTQICVQNVFFLHQRHKFVFRKFFFCIKDSNLCPESFFSALKTQICPKIFANAEKKLKNST